MDQNSNGRPPVPFSNGDWDKTGHDSYQNQGVAQNRRARAGLTLPQTTASIRQLTRTP